MSLKSIHISIPSPCHESWDRMDATAHGAFCHSCRTEVIDFSAMTDREVIEYLSKNKTGCGRFRMDQLDTNLTVTRVDNGTFRWRALALSILSLVSVKNICALSAGTIPVHQDSIPTSVHRHSLSSDTFTLQEVTVAPLSRDLYPHCTYGVSVVDLNSIQAYALDSHKIRDWFQRLFRKKHKNEVKVNSD